MRADSSAVSIFCRVAAYRFTQSKSNIIPAKTDSLQLKVFIKNVDIPVVKKIKNYLKLTQNLHKLNIKISKYVSAIESLQGINQAGW
jgi:hypothetical protein